MKIDTPEHMAAINEMFPILPWALQQMQSDVSGVTSIALREATRATVFHDLVMSRGEEVFDGHHAISVRRVKEQRHFVLPDVLVRVHRGRGNDLRISINETIQTEEWDFVGPLEEFPDPNTRFHLVYSTDPTWSMIDKCIIGHYHRRDRIAWREIDVDDWYQGHDPGFELGPTGPSDVARRRLRLKPEIQREIDLEAQGDGQNS